MAISPLNVMTPQRAAALSMWLALLLGSAVSQAQNVALPEVRARFRESVTLDLDSQILKSIGTAQDHIADKNWSQAIGLLQQHIDEHADAFVPVEPGRYSNVAEFAHGLIARFPDEGLKLYRDRVDPLVREAFEVGKRDLDERQLRRVVQTGFNSSFGDDALWLLGDLAFERGDFTQARTYWEHLLPTRLADGSNALKPTLFELTYPSPSVSQADVAARLILCSYASGELKVGDQELAAFRTLYPNAKGHLAGRDGLLISILEQVRAESLKWNANAVSATDWVTLGGKNSRSNSAQKPVTSFGLNWSTTLPNQPYVTGGLRLAFKERRPLSFHPIVWNDGVFIAGPESVHAINLHTGQPLWPQDGGDSNSIYSNVGEVPVRPNLETVGVASYSATIDQGRLYARLGPPIVRRSRNEAHTFSEIIGLDLEAEGRLCFQRSSSVLDGPDVSAEATSWSFEGTPVVEGGRLWVSARRGVPEEEIVVVCFDTESGQLLWRRRLCSVLRNSPEHINIIGHRVLTLAEGRLLIDTGSGAIAALDADSGRVQWLATYETQAREESPIELGDPQRFGISTCVVAEGMVFAAPSDSPLVFALDVATGRTVWQQPIPDRVLHLLGVSDHKLVLSGRKLWALDVQSGRPAWPDGRVGFDDPRGFGYGRGVIAEDSIYWPLREELLRVDVRSGKLLGRWALQEAIGESGGNLVIADGLLLVAQSDKLVALGEPVEVVAPQVPKLGSTQRAPSRTAQIEFPRSPLPKPVLQKPASARSVDVETSKQTLAASPWPASRLWSHPLQPSDTLLVPESATRSEVAANAARLAVIQSNQRLTALDPRSGRITWTAATADANHWLESVGSTLLLGSERGLSARLIDSGRPQWTAHFASSDRTPMREFRMLPGAAQPEKTTASNVVLCCANDRLVAVDANSGQWYWQIAPDIAPAVLAQLTQQGGATPSGSVGHSSSTLAHLESSLLFFRPQTSGLMERFDVESWRRLAPLRLPRTTRRVIVVQRLDGRDDQRLVTLSDDLRLQGRSPTGELLWDYKDRISNTFQHPELRHADECVILIENGLFARRLDLNSGDVLWSKGLSRFPLMNLTDSLTLSRDGLLCLSEGTLRRFRLSDGRRSWEHYLGPGNWRFAEAATSPITAHAPLAAVNPPIAVVWMSNSTATRVFACFEQSGDPIQQLELPPTERTRPVRLLGDQLLFAANHELIGLGYQQ